MMKDEVMKINLLNQAAVALSILKSQAVTSLGDNGEEKEVSMSLAKASLGALPPSSSHVVPADQDTVPTCVNSHQTASSGATAASATIVCAAETLRSNSSATPLALRSSINHDDINNGRNHGKGTNYLTSYGAVLKPDPGQYVGANSFLENRFATFYEYGFGKEQLIYTVPVQHSL